MGSNEKPLNTAKLGSGIHGIVDQIEGRDKVGCGCLGLLVVVLLAVYLMVRLLFGSADLSLVFTVTLGVFSYFAAKVRGFHVLTATAWVVLGLMAVGIAPMVFEIIDPAAFAKAVPGWMQERTWTWVLVVVSAGALLALLFQMRRTISTAETLFAIQLQAAARTMSVDNVEEKINAALNILQEDAELGLWPKNADFLQDIEAPPLPRGHEASTVLSPVVVVRARPTSSDAEGWVRFGAQPFLAASTSWAATVDKMAPFGVGQLFCDTHRLHYVPIRPKAAGLSVELGEIKRVRVYIHALEVETKDNTYAFVGVHLWRVLSVALFLRSYEVETELVDEALYASRLRDDHLLETDLPVIEAIPACEALSQRIDVLWQGEGRRRTDAEQAACDELLRVSASTLPTFRAVSDRILRILEDIEAGRSETARELFAGTSLWLESLPTEAISFELERLIEDLEGLLLLSDGDWDELKSYASELPRRDGSDDDGDPRLEALLRSIDHLEEGDRPSARGEIEKAANGWPGSIFVEALEQAAAEES